MKALYALAATAVLLLSGCGGDGFGAADNPDSAPQLLDGNGGGGGGIVVHALPEAGTPLVIDSENGGSVIGSSAVVDGSGNVTLIWTQSDGAVVDLWASRYRVGMGWTNAQKLEDGTLDVSDFKVVIDAAGNVTVAWIQEAATSYSAGPDTINVIRTDLWAARFSAAGEYWEYAERVENSDLPAATTEDLEDIGELQMVVDGAGTVSLLWMQHNGSRYALYALHDAATLWTLSPATPVRIDNAAHGDVSTPQLLAAASGRLYAFWIQAETVSGTTYQNLWAGRFSAGSWATESIESENGLAEPPVAVVDASGVATLAWRQLNPSYWNLWTLRYSATGPAGAAQRVGNGAMSVSQPSLQLYGATPSRVMLLWVESDLGGTMSNVRARHYDAAWFDDGVISSMTGHAGSISMVSDTSGYLTAAWVQNNRATVNPLDEIWVNRFTFSSGSWGWRGPSLIDTGISSDARAPMLMADAANRVMLLFLQESGDSGRFDLWSSFYSGGQWGTAAYVDSSREGAVGSAGTPQWLINGAGDTIMLMWHQSYEVINPSNFSRSVLNYLVITSHTAANGWGPVANITPGYDDAYSAQLLMGGDGVTTVTWLQPMADSLNSGFRTDLLANRF